MRCALLYRPCREGCQLLQEILASTYKSQLRPWTGIVRTGDQIGLTAEAESLSIGGNHCNWHGQNGRRGTFAEGDNWTVLGTRNGVRNKEETATRGLIWGREGERGGQREPGNNVDVTVRRGLRITNLRNCNTP